MQYQIISGVDEDLGVAKRQLEAEVTNALSNGWTCTGGVAMNVWGGFPEKPYRFVFSQAVVKVSE